MNADAREDIRELLIHHGVTWGLSDPDLADLVTDLARLLEAPEPDGEVFRVVSSFTGEVIRSPDASQRGGRAQDSGGQGGMARCRVITGQLTGQVH